MSEPDTASITDDTWTASDSADEGAAPAVADETPQDKQPGARREKSTIRFPYMDIRDATTIAKTLKSNFGTSCALDQMAAALDQPQSSGAFRTRLSSAATYGVIVSKAGKVSLTDLGHRVADDHTRAAALVDAFMAVPLYTRIYKEYQGRSLPGDAGLEKQIEEFGVVAKQTDRARQVFTRSADQAGLFWSGKDKLVLPAVANGQDVPTLPDPGRGDSGQEDSGGGSKEKMSDAPLLKALWDTLPADKNFTTEQRKRFFTALAFNIDYVYGPPSDGGSLNPTAVGALWSESAQD